MFTPLAFFYSGLPEDLPEYLVLFWRPEHETRGEPDFFGISPRVNRLAY
jgi:hypothetical protein